MGLKIKTAAELLRREQEAKKDFNDSLAFGMSVNRQIEREIEAQSARSRYNLNQTQSSSHPPTEFALGFSVTRQMIEDDKMYHFEYRGEKKMGCKKPEICLTQTEKVCIDSMVANGETLGTMVYVILNCNRVNDAYNCIERYIAVKNVREAIQRYIDGEDEE